MQIEIHGANTQPFTTQRNFMKDAKCTEGHRISRAPSKGQNLLLAKIVKGMRYRD